MTTPRKAVALVSGGLDSMLAVKLMLDQGIHVEGLNFFTGFCVEGHTHAIRKKDQSKVKRNNALWVAEHLGIKLHIIDIVEEYKEVVTNPQYGYGANLNPCLDCKIFMVKKAKEWMEKHDFDFMITGEVIGQRPMSQRKKTMPIVTEQSGVNDRLLRPLCAKNLPLTLPEREGWVNREQLLNFSGRNRTPQINLAKGFGIEEYAQPAGGCCFLTDKNYTKKLQDIWEIRGEKRYEFEDIMLLKVGRHIRPNKKYKLIIGREEGENNFLEGFRKKYIHFRTTSHLGPLTLLDGNANEEDIKLAAQIAARFSQGRDEKAVTVTVHRPQLESYGLEVQPFPQTDLPKEWYL